MATGDTYTVCERCTRRFAVGNVPTNVCGDCDENQRLRTALAAEREKNTAGPDRVLRCAFCGFAYPDGTPTHKHESLAAHIRECKEHPVGRELRLLQASFRTVESERDALAAAERERDALKWVPEYGQCNPVNVTEWLPEFSVGSKTDKALTECGLRTDSLRDMLRRAANTIGAKHESCVFYQGLVYKACNEVDGALNRHASAGTGTTDVGMPDGVRLLADRCMKAEQENHDLRAERDAAKAEVERLRARVTTLEAFARLAADAPACGPDGSLYYEIQSDDGQVGCMHVDPLGWIGDVSGKARAALTPAPPQATPTGEEGAGQ